ncbi:hypothetical protein [Pyruvatibacter mobilis]|uniref:hypothetical protein n=1 Tax=Pyruvatibacter mobilis TaxID=1712261 RepID=UPI003C7E4121
MSRFTANMMSADRGTEEKYSFDGPDDLLSKSPIKVLKAFFETVEGDIIPKADIDYEINAAFKRDTAMGPVVTAMGTLHLHDSPGPAMPFMVMISADG